jgi:peptidoglycan hydrolase CwlO-like protein
MKMPTAFICALFFQFFYIIAYGQTTDILIEPKPMSKGTQPAYILNLPGAKLKEIETMWGKYVSRGTKEKIQNNKGEWTIIGAVERNISPSPFYIYATLLETTEGVRLTSFFSEQDVFLAPGTAPEEKLLAIKKYLNDFAQLVQIQKTKSDLEAEQKILKIMEGSLSDLQKKFDQSEKRAAESKRTIEKNEAEIRRIEREIDMKNTQISQQKELIVKLANALGDEKKAAQNTLKGLEKDKAKLYKEKEKMSREIDKCKANIRNQEREQAKINVQKSNLQTDIDKQNEKVRNIQEKLAAIPNPGIKL